MTLDPYDVRRSAASAKEYFKDRPRIHAVYEIILAFNRHQHESAPMSEVRRVVEREAARLGRYPKDLRVQTDAVLARDEALSEREYRELLTRWHSLRGDLENGTQLLPYLILVLLLGGVVLGAYLLLKRS